MYAPIPDDVEVTRSHGLVDADYGRFTHAPRTQPTQPPRVACCSGHMPYLGMAIATEEGPNLVPTKGIASTVLGVLDIFLGNARFIRVSTMKRSSHDMKEHQTRDSTGFRGTLPTKNGGFTGKMMESAEKTMVEAAKSAACVGSTVRHAGFVGLEHQQREYDEVQETDMPNNVDFNEFDPWQRHTYSKSCNQKSKTTSK